MAKTAAITLAFLLAIFEIGSCIRCYQCNSEQDAGCGDPFKSTKYLVDCALPQSNQYNILNLRDVLTNEISGTVAGAPRYCHKIITRTGSIARTCLDVNPADLNHTCRIMEKNSNIKYCGVCDKDSCNGAGATSISFPLATLALIITYFFCKQ